ncbi:MAG: heterodisulfide reductase-related iron-sulfur binding cluster [Candidatus Binatia bacterium]
MSLRLPASAIFGAKEIAREKQSRPAASRHSAPGAGLCAGDFHALVHGQPRIDSRQSTSRSASLDHRQSSPKQVILRPDTFNNNFFPEVPKAAVKVLEAAGYHVMIPERSLCCGRPLYDFGMLDIAKRLLCQILETLRPQLAPDIPIVGLEPSCVAVFRDELVNFFPNDQDAKRLATIPTC